MLNVAVKDAIERRKWEVDYMTFEMKIQDEREDEAEKVKSENAKCMLADGVPYEKVAKYANLPLSRVLELAATK